MLTRLKEFSGFLHLSGSRLFITGISFLIMILISRNMETAEFGLFSLILGYYAYASIISEFGLRTIATNEGALRKTGIAVVLRPYLQIRIIISLLCLAVIMCASNFIVPNHFLAVFIVMSTMVMAAFHIDWILLARKDYKSAAWASTVRWIAYLIFIAGVTIFHGRLDLLTMSIIFMLSWVAAIIFSWILVVRSTPVSIIRIKDGEDAIKPYDMICRGLPVLGSTLIYQLLQNVDLLWVGYHFGTEKAAIYYIANAVISMGFIFSNSMAQVALAKHADLTIDNTQFRNILSNDLLLIIGISVVLSFGIYFILPPLIPLVFGIKFAESADITAYFIPYFIFYQVSTVLAFFMIAVQMQKQVFKANLITACILPFIFMSITPFDNLISIALAKSVLMFITIALMASMLIEKLDHER